MRLLDYGLGEILDRLSILALKIANGESAGKDVAHFRRERSKLLPLTATKVDGVVFEAYAELAVVNGRLWEAENRLRQWRREIEQGPLSATSLDVMNTAFEIQALDDRRAALIQMINDTTGAPAGVEKLHVDRVE